MTYLEAFRLLEKHDALPKGLSSEFYLNEGEEVPNDYIYRYMCPTCMTPIVNNYEFNSVKSNCHRKEGLSLFDICSNCWNANIDIDMNSIINKK